MRCLAMATGILVAAFAAIPAQSQAAGTAEPQSPAVQPSPAITDAAPAGGVAAQPASSGLYRISGFVLSGADSHPLRNATVQIQPSQGQPGKSEKTTTDENGYFAFSEVGAGMFNLQGSAEGYLTTLYEQHGIFSTGIVTGAGVDTESLILKLQPQGSVSFTVVDENGEPVEHANIHLFREGHNLGENRRVSAAVGSTNDAGRFQFQRLAPGTYFAAVTAQPWYAVHPNVALRGQQIMPFGFVESIDPSVDVAYPVTYYPGVTDSGQAAAVQLRPGEELNLQVQLRPEPALSITVPEPADAQPQGAPGAPPAPRVRPIPQVYASVFGEPVPMPTQESRVNGGDAVITGIAPGEYKVSQAGREPFSRQQGTLVRLSDHPVSVAAASSETAHLTVQLRTGNGEPASRAQVMLMRDHAMQAMQSANEKGVATFDVPAGDYYFSAAMRGHPLYVRQVVRGDRPVASESIQVVPGQSAVYTVTAVAGTQTLRGLTQVDGRPAHGIFVLLLPTAELHTMHTLFRQQSDLDGSFQITGVPPGDYTLFAIQDGWMLNWNEPGVLDRYVTGAAAAHVGEEAAGVQTLPRPVTVQSR